MGYKNKIHCFQICSILFFLPFNNDYMCLLHIQASEKHINHFYGIEQKIYLRISA